MTSPVDSALPQQQQPVQDTVPAHQPNLDGTPAGGNAGVHSDQVQEMVEDELTRRVLRALLHKVGSEETGTPPEAAEGMCVAMASWPPPLGIVPDDYAAASEVLLAACANWIVVCETRVLKCAHTRILPPQKSCAGCSKARRKCSLVDAAGNRCDRCTARGIACVDLPRTRTRTKTLAPLRARKSCTACVKGKRKCKRSIPGSRCDRCNAHGIACVDLQRIRRVADRNAAKRAELALAQSDSVESRVPPSQ